MVGGGYSGLWTALLAKERHPERDVLLLEAGRIGWAASGRNGGFCSASLTHGEANGRARWPDEYDTLDRLGRENLDAIEETVRRHGIDCDFERTGELTVATAPHEVEWLRDAAADGGGEFLDRAQVRAELDSPTYLAGLRDPAAMFERLFETNGWGGSWRNGIYDYVHYHPRTHEVLGIARGRARVSRSPSRCGSASSCPCRCGRAGRGPCPRAARSRRRAGCGCRRSRCRGPRSAAWWRAQWLSPR